MKLTQRLLKLLNRVFDKDAHAYLAFRVRYVGGMTWTVADGVMSFVLTGGPSTDFSVDLGSHTVQSLVGFLAGKAGFEVTALDASRQALSARVLMDGSGDQDASNGDHLYGFTSLLWAYLDAVAGELKIAQDTVSAAPKMMNVAEGEGGWLDEIGSYYKVERKAGEPDDIYGPRIIAEATRPKSNNVAMENAIEVLTGTEVRVTDATNFSGAPPIYDGSISHNGIYFYSSSDEPLYGLFDVSYEIDLINDASFVDIAAAVIGVVEVIRAAGTQMRPFTFRGYLLDVVPAVPEESLSLFITVDTLHDGTALYNGTSQYQSGTYPI